MYPSLPVEVALLQDQRGSSKYNKFLNLQLFPDSPHALEQLGPASVYKYAWLKWTIWTGGMGPVLTQSSLSNMTKLSLLDSLQLEVCIPALPCASGPSQGSKRVH